MGMQPAPKKKVKLFDNVTLHGNYVGVLRPTRDEESNIEIPDTAEGQENISNALARVVTCGPDAEDFEKGSTVLVSLYMQQPHQIISRTDEEGNEYAMFIIDSDMIVATVDTQKDRVKEMVTKGKV